MKIRSKSKRLNNSYQKTFRNRHPIAFERKLSDQEYRLWDLYIALYDWDKRHEHYGCVVDTDLHIAEMLDWSESKVCRYRNSLVEKGIVKMDERSVVKVWPIPGYDENRLNKNNPNLATLRDQPHKDDVESFMAEPDPIQNSIISNFPNKVNTSKFSISTEEEYKSFKDEYELNGYFIEEDKYNPYQKVEVIKRINRNKELKTALEKYEYKNCADSAKFGMADDEDEEMPF